jgi:hypothetical protein
MKIPGSKRLCHAAFVVIDAGSADDPSPPSASEVDPRWCRTT